MFSSIAAQTQLTGMAQERVDWPNLDVIWISHLHLDHCGGLASFCLD